MTRTRRATAGGWRRLKSCLAASARVLHPKRQLSGCGMPWRIGLAWPLRTERRSRSHALPQTTAGASWFGSQLASMPIWSVALATRASASINSSPTPSQVRWAGEADPVVGDERCVVADRGPRCAHGQPVVKTELEPFILSGGHNGVTESPAGAATIQHWTDSLGRGTEYRDGIPRHSTCCQGSLGAGLLTRCLRGSRTGASQAVPHRVRCVHSACTASRDHPAPTGTGHNLGLVPALRSGTT